MTYRTCGDATMGITAPRPSVGSVGRWHTPGTGWFGSPIYKSFFFINYQALDNVKPYLIYQHKKVAIDIPAVH